MLLGMRVHPKVVQEILGHSEIAVTMDIYSHVLPTMQEDAMQRINEVLQGVKNSFCQNPCQLRQKQERMRTSTRS
jgi:site-specific recombinase XerD